VSRLRPGFAQLALVARGEARLAFARAPEIIQHVLVIFGWAALAIFLGSVVGFAAVLLPPTGAFGIVAAVGLVLIWVMPDLSAVPDRVVRRLLFAEVIVNLCLPYYYAVLVEGLPFISVRRLFVFPLILLLAIAIGGSSEVRRKMADIMRTDRFLSACVFGFLAIIFISITVSANPTSSLSRTIDTILEWYVPLVAMLYALRSESDVELLIRIICWSTLFVVLMGLVEFIVHFNVFLHVLPKSMLAALAASGPTFANLIQNGSSGLRNGMYRASSTYTSELSFAEFCAMIAPLAVLFLLHARSTRDRAFGGVLLLATFLGIIISGSRGGYVAVFSALVVLLPVWLLRTYRFKPQSMSPAVGLLVGGATIVVAVLLVMFWTRAHNAVLGGGAEQYSNQGRQIEWALATPKILRSPIIGYGYGTAGDVVGYFPLGASFPTVDSYLISLLVETGVIGTVLFFGMLFIAIWRGLRRYVADPSWYGALAAGPACALTAYMTYRTVLSQIENNDLCYIFVGCVLLMEYYGGKTARAAERGGARSP
jgi:O-antigen ligase